MGVQAGSESKISLEVELLAMVADDLVEEKFPIELGDSWFSPK